MMLFGFGRVPGCLGLGALFLRDGWREGRTNGQSASGTVAGAEFPCGVPGGGEPSALCWAAAGAEFSCGELGGGGIGAALDVLWGLEFLCNI